MLVNTKELLQDSRGGIASFNVVDFDMARACIEAAEETQRPVIIGVAVRHWKTLGGPLFVPSVRALCLNSEVPAALHLDHAGPDNLNIIDQALESGFSSIMIDASKMPFRTNIEVTKGSGRACPAVQCLGGSGTGSASGRGGCGRSCRYRGGLFTRNPAKPLNSVML
ncbi:class II fructose-bisphosphate aldolase [Marispirochaeta sp.]|uniref:class II fructose-bisphosphate aldolase n=1 Tax=Marispirochaeta sp. TaxID=2038653 RepID=UPI0029C69653|nr:class II fructose-bisphosphate aldolase [Marispirochaeta sp.]